VKAHLIRRDLEGSVKRLNLLTRKRITSSQQLVSALYRSCYCCFTAVVVAGQRDEEQQEAAGQIAATTKSH
jgi:hypothetical protein